MNIKPVGSNQTELHLDNGNVVLFSYETPVAAKIAEGYVKTSTKYSKTTTKHVNAWIGHNVSVEEPQEFLNSLAK